MLTGSGRGKNVSESGTEIPAAANSLNSNESCKIQLAMEQDGHWFVVALTKSLTPLSCQFLQPL